MFSNSDSIFNTVAVFGIVTFVVYLILSRTHRRRDVVERDIHNATQRNTSLNNGISNGIAASSATKPGLNERCQRVPPHVSSTSAKLAVNSGSNLLIDGIVAFRHTKAACEDQVLTEEEITDNRKDRARLLSRLLEDTATVGDTVSTPPAIGSTVVVSVPINDIKCPKLQRVLYLLGTFYNLFTIIVIDNNQQFEGDERENVISVLRGKRLENEADENNENSSLKKIHLNEDILPSHRIIASTSVTGRVAFARQLQRIELMLDFDAEVKNLLSRFGHRVIVYGEKSESLPEGVSKLGSVIL